MILSVILIAVFLIFPVVFYKQLDNSDDPDKI